jgi:hypothetical protein
MKIYLWNILNFKSFGIGFFIQYHNLSLSISFDFFFLSFGFRIYKDICEIDLFKK